MWTPSSLEKRNLHITPDVLLVLFSPRTRGRTGPAYSHSACCLTDTLWLHGRLPRLVYSPQKKLVSTAGERFADSPVMSYVVWFSRWVMDLFGQVISKSRTLMSHSCLLWNCKIIFWASVSVTPFCAHLADSRHLCCQNTWQDENFTFIMLSARKVRQFNKTRTHVSDKHSLPHAEAHLARYAPNILFEQTNQTAKYHLKGFPPEKLLETQVLEWGTSVLLSFLHRL